MSLDKFSHEELKNKPMLELAGLILEDAKKALSFQEIYDQIAEIKEFTKKKKEEKISQFYTELNVDGRFMTIGSNMWGLKIWYPVEQADEEITSTPKKKRKSKKKTAEEAEDIDENEDLELEEDVDLIELGDEDEEADDADFGALEEELDVEEEDFEEEVSDVADELDEDEKI